MYAHNNSAARAQADRLAPRSISAVDLLKTFFEHTTEQVYTCSFPNERDDPKQAGERHVHTRLPSHINEFMSKWDKPGRGLFFCVGTVKAGAIRNKENIVETIGLHADLDFKDIDLGYTREQIVCKLESLQYPPSAIVFSGNHCIAIGYSKSRWKRSDRRACAM